MTTPSSITVGQRLRPHDEESAMSDIQQVVGRVVAVLRHRRWLFVFPMLTGMLGSLVFGLLLPRKYELSTSFARRHDPVITNLVTSQSPYAFKLNYRSLVLEMVGYKAIESAVEDLGLDKDFPRDAAGALTKEGQVRQQALIRRLQPQLRVIVLDQNNKQEIVEVQYNGDRPDLGVKIVSQLVDNYVTRMGSEMTKVLSETQKFFRQEVDKRKKVMVRGEAELIQVSVEHPGVNPSNPGFLDQQMAVVTKAIAACDRKLAELRTDIDARQACLREIDAKAAQGGEYVSSESGVVSARMVRNPQRQRLQSQMEQVRTTIANAKTVQQMTDAHPYVAGLRQKLLQLRIEFERLPKRVAGESVLADGADAIDDRWETERRRITMELVSLQKKSKQQEEERAQFKEKQANIEQEMSTIFERRQDFMALEKEIATTSSDLVVWQKKLEEIDRILTAESEDRGIKFVVVTDPRIPSKPVVPKLSGILMLASGVGLGLGIALVFLREIFDRSVRCPTRVHELLGVPVLEAIGDIKVGQRNALFSRRGALWVAAAIQVVAVLVMGVLNYLSLQQPAVYERITTSATSLLSG